MSSGEGLDISYYSAHLARALKKNDVLYKQVDDLICCIVDEDKAKKIKQEALRFSKLPLSTLSHKIAWLEQLGVSPLKLPEMDSMADALELKDMVDDIENVDCKQEESEEVGVSKKLCSSFPAEHPELRHIDSDVDEAQSTTRSLPILEFNNIATTASQQNLNSQNQCAIDMNDINLEETGCMNNYDTPVKNLFTDEDHNRELLHKRDHAIEAFLQGAPNGPANLSQKLSDDGKKNSKTKKKSNSKAIPFENECSTVYNKRYDTNCTAMEQKCLISNDLESSFSEKAKSTCISKQREDLEQKQDKTSRVAKQEKHKRKGKAKDRSDILDDATVEEILKMVGESCENADHRKKSKEPKHAAMKKEKKKTKKQKKAEKKKATGPKVLSDPESSEPVSKVELEEKSVYSGPETSSLPVDENEEEFITAQKRKRNSHKYPASGRTSPFKHESTRRRRYSDPSPAVADQQSPLFDSGQKADKEKASFNLKNNSVAARNESYDRTSQAQWPNLPSRHESHDSAGTSRSKTASYASKLKSNLDSTGCSLASSSEESSSSSSTSSNNEQRRPAERTSPVQNYPNTLSNISRTIEAAVGFVHDRSGTDQLAPHMEEEHGINFVDKPIKLCYHYKDNQILQTGKTFSSCQDKPVITVKQKKASTSDEPMPTIAQNSSTTVQVHSNLKAADKAQREAKSSNVEKRSTGNVMTELSNDLGLTFIIEDLSDVINVSSSKGSAMNADHVHFTFGDGKVLVDELSELPTDVGADKHSDDSVNVEMQSSERYANFLSDPGNFDMKKAIATLHQEWKNALVNGTRFEDL